MPDNPSQDRSASPAPDRLRTKIYLPLAGVFLAMAAACAIGLWYHYDEALDVGERRAENLAHILSDHLGRSVEAIDTTLTQLNLHSQRVGGPTANAESWGPVLAAAYTALNSVGSISVTDENGIIVHATIPEIVGQSRRDLFLFQRLSRNAGDGLVADPPFTAVRSGRSVLPLARRLTDVNGRFLGVVVATLEPERLRQFYRSVDVGPNGVIWALHPSGIVLFREPSRVDPIGQSAKDNPLFAAQQARPGADVLRAALEPGGARYVSAYRGSTDPPLTVTVSLAERDILARWREEAVVAGVVMSGVAFMFLLAGFRIGREIRARTEADTRVAQANTALVQEAEERRRLFETSVDVIFITDSQGQFIRVSPSVEPTLGYHPDEMTGHSGADFIYPEDLDPTRNEMRMARRGKLMRNFETRYVHKDGRVIALNWTGIWSDPGQQHFFIGRDVTEQKIAEERLRQSQKMEAVGQLTGGIAHDFNNMLTVITGTIDILADAVADKPQAAAIAKLISDAADRGAELTGRLLSFARKQPLQPRETSINALVADAGKMLQPLLGAQIEIESRLEPDAWPALVDPTQLTTALLNLAVNARDAMPQGGRLTLETANVVLDESYARLHNEVIAGPYVMLAVSDTGAGIPAELRDKVFEPFFTTKELGKGTGLGLSMVYGFVKQSGGHIKVYSEVGHGTTIKIYLPRQGAHGESSVEASPALSMEGGGETVLIVEDDVQVHASVIAQLESLGYLTLAAPNAAEALKLIEAGAAFDVLFTDVIMPGPMNGRQLADELARRKPGLKVLFTSGYTENAIIHHGRLDPGFLLLAKPYRKSELARMIRQALGAPGMGTGSKPDAAA